MSVYVDDMQAGFGNMVMCHMIADTNKELLEMADSIKVQRKWIQKGGTLSEHFDICLSKRKLAVKCGAIEVSQRQLVLKIRARNNLLSKNPPAPAGSAGRAQPQTTPDPQCGSAPTT